jgi:hypothetical protein
MKGGGEPSGASSTYHNLVQSAFFMLTCMLELAFAVKLTICCIVDRVNEEYLKP